MMLLKNTLILNLVVSSLVVKELNLLATNEPLDFSSNTTLFESLQSKKLYFKNQENVKFASIPLIIKSNMALKTLPAQNSKFFFFHNKTNSEYPNSGAQNFAFNMTTLNFSKYGPDSNWVSYNTFVKLKRPALELTTERQEFNFVFNASDLNSSDSSTKMLNFSTDTEYSTVAFIRSTTQVADFTENITTLFAHNSSMITTEPTFLTGKFSTQSDQTNSTKYPFLKNFYSFPDIFKQSNLNSSIEDVTEETHVTTPTLVSLPNVPVIVKSNQITNTPTVEFNATTLEVPEMTHSLYNHLDQQSNFTVTSITNAVNFGFEATPLSDELDFTDISSIATPEHSIVDKETAASLTTENLHTTEDSVFVTSPIGLRTVLANRVDWNETFSTSVLVSTFPEIENTKNVTETMTFSDNVQLFSVNASASSGLTLGTTEEYYTTPSVYRKVLLPNQTELNNTHFIPLPIDEVSFTTGSTILTESSIPELTFTPKVINNTETFTFIVEPLTTEGKRIIPLPSKLNETFSSTQLNAGTLVTESSTFEPVVEFNRTNLTTVSSESSSSTLSNFGQVPGFSTKTSETVTEQTSLENQTKFVRKFSSVASNTNYETTTENYTVGFQHHIKSTQTILLDFNVGPLQSEMTTETSTGLTHEFKVEPLRATLNSITESSISKNDIAKDTIQPVVWQHQKNQSFSVTISESGISSTNSTSKRTKQILKGQFALKKFETATIKPVAHNLSKNEDDNLMNGIAHLDKPIAIMYLFMFIIQVGK